MDARKLAKLESSLDELLDEASWLLSHAQALADYNRREEAEVELARAANCKEQAAYLLDVVGREQEAVVHRISAASCYEQLGQQARAATLLRAVLSAQLAEPYRREVVKQLADCLAKATMRKTPSAAKHKLASAS